MKKILFLLFVLMLLPVMANAFEGKVEIKGICYHILTKGKKAEVVKLNSGNYSGNIIIPSTVMYDGVVCDVTSIVESAFSRCPGLTSVTIPNSVTTIGRQAFAYSTKLTSVKIPNTVTTIGDGAFGECTSLTSITISNNVTEIKELTFYNCRRLTSVIIPNSITNIGHMAFYNCNSMKSITIPNSVTTIAESAFENCSGLKSITIPNSVTWIGYRAFSGCKGLTSVTIPNSVTRIVDFAFSSCSDLTDVYCYIKDLSCVEFAFGIFSNSYLEYTTLHVPNASLETYKMKKPWSEFGKIVPLESFDDYESVSDEELEAVKDKIEFSDKELESVNMEQQSQHEKESTMGLNNDNSKVYDNVDEMPQFPGTAWFVFGTKKELKEQKILDDSEVLCSTFNKEYFTKIDIRIDKEIKLYSKTAELLTSHPAGSYTLLRDANKRYVLRITDPQAFWSTSKYLVIQVK